MMRKSSLIAKQRIGHSTLIQNPKLNHPRSALTVDEKQCLKSYNYKDS